VKKVWCTGNEERDVSRKEKGALGSKKIMYFRTKFKCSKNKIIYFGIEGTHRGRTFRPQR